MRKVRLADGELDSEGRCFPSNTFAAGMDWVERSCEGRRVVAEAALVGSEAVSAAGRTQHTVAEDVSSREDCQTAPHTVGGLWPRLE